MWSHGAGHLYAVIVARARTGPRRAASRDKAGSALGRGGLAAAAARPRAARNSQDSLQCARSECSTFFTWVLACVY